MPPTFDTRTTCSLVLTAILWLAGHSPALTAATHETAADQVLVGWGSSKLPNANLGTITKIAAGGAYTIALRSDGALVGWGVNLHGQATPPAGNNYTAIAAGQTHALALTTDGTIVGWGYNDFGEATPPAGTFKAIAAGAYRSLALKADGSLVQWGEPPPPAPQPYTPLPTGNNFVAIAAGTTHFLALRTDGSIAAWGENGTDQINAPAGTGFTAIAAGGFHSLALRADGTVAAWGATGINHGGQATAPPGTDFTAIAAGYQHSLALRADGTILAWGFGDITIVAPAGNFVGISAREHYNVALRADGTISEWGYGGLGLTAPYSGVAQAVAGEFHGLALMQNGSVVGWGENTSGQAEPPPDNDFTAVAVGSDHSVALRTNGSIAVWGFSGFEPPPTGNGFLAIGAAATHNVAIKGDHSLAFWGSDSLYGISNLPAGNDFTAIAVGTKHCLALKSDGTIVGWGRNDYGQATPPAGTDFTAIAVGRDHSVALRSNGSLAAWGRNAAGQASAPTDTTYTAIAAGEDLSVAVTTAGAVVEWGVRTPPVSAPLRTPPSGLMFSKVSVGGRYVLALGSATDPFAPPTINTHPANQSVTLGQPASFTVGATGTAPLSYQWQKGGVDISGATSASYSIPSAQLSDAGSYDVVVTNAHGFATSNAATLTVTETPVAPGITTHPANQTVTVGQTATFTVAASGTAPLSYQWRKGGANITGATSATYTINNSQTSAAGSYDVVVTNAHGSATSTAATFTVNLAPPTITITYPLNGESFPAIGRIPFTVALSGDTSGLTSIKLMEGIKEHSETSNFAPPIQLLSRGLDLGDVGRMTFKAVASFSIGPPVESAPVTVVVFKDCVVEWLHFLEFGPGPLSGLSSAKEKVQRTVANMVAQATGLDLDLFRRFRDEVLLTTPAGRYYADLYERTSIDMIETLVTNPSLALDIHQALLDWTPAIQAMVDSGQAAAPVITPAMAAQAGELLSRLRAIATGNLAATMDAETAALDPATWSGMSAGQLLGRVEAQVRPPPAITAQPTAKTVVIGGSTTFSVQPAGAGPFTYQWRRNGVNIAGATSDTLTVSNVQPGGAGSYTVVVSNPFGSTTSSAVTLALDTTPRLINVSCLASAGSSDSTLVIGFYLNGTGSKDLLIRGVGPTLGAAPFNRPGMVVDPQISVFNSVGVLIDSNDDWDSALAPDFSRMGAFGLVNGSKDAALKITLAAPGLYTVHLVNSAPIADGLIEVYDLSRDTGSRLTNVSCRLNMKAGETVILGTALIANPVPVLARAVGPGLAPYVLEPPSALLPDPDLRVYVGATEIAFNDDWEFATKPYFGAAGAFPIADGSKDAALRVVPTPGSLTIHATGKGATGIAIIELYESP